MTRMQAANRHLSYSLLLCGFLLLEACQLSPGRPEAQIARLAGTSWRVESLGGVQVSAQIDSTLEVDAQGQIAGRGGCNAYVSDIGIESESIHFAKVLASEFGCTKEQTAQEQQFFSALAATRATRFDSGRLLLLDEKGTTLARLGRLNLLIKPP